MKTRNSLGNSDFNILGSRSMQDCCLNSDGSYLALIFDWIIAQEGSGPSTVIIDTFYN